MKAAGMLMAPISVQLELRSSSQRRLDGCSHVYEIQRVQKRVLVNEGFQ
jgi:hypothetical protein